MHRAYAGCIKRGSIIGRDISKQLMLLGGRARERGCSLYRAMDVVVGVGTVASRRQGYRQSGPLCPPSSGPAVSEIEGVGNGRKGSHCGGSGGGRVGCERLRWSGGDRVDGVVCTVETRLSNFFQSLLTWHSLRRHIYHKRSNHS